MTESRLAVVSYFSRNRFIGSKKVLVTNKQTDEYSAHCYVTYVRLSDGQKRVDCVTRGDSPMFDYGVREESLSEKERETLHRIREET